MRLIEMIRSYLTTSRSAKDVEDSDTSSAGTTNFNKTEQYINKIQASNPAASRFEAECMYNYACIKGGKINKNTPLYGDVRQIGVALIARNQVTAACENFIDNAAVRELQRYNTTRQLKKYNNAQSSLFEVFYKNYREIVDFGVRKYLQRKSTVVKKEVYNRLVLPVMVFGAYVLLDVFGTPNMVSAKIKAHTSLKMSGATNKVGMRVEGTQQEIDVNIATIKLGTYLFAVRVTGYVTRAVVMIIPVVTALVAGVFLAAAAAFSILHNAVTKKTLQPHPELTKSPVVIYTVGLLIKALKFDVDPISQIVSTLRQIHALRNSFKEMNLKLSEERAKHNLESEVEVAKSNSSSSKDLSQTMATPLIWSSSRKLPDRKSRFAFANTVRDGSECDSEQGSSRSLERNVARI